MTAPKANQYARKEPSRLKTARINLVLTQAEKADWQARAKADKIAVAQYIRNAMAAYRTDE
jgi:hypothetical protein